MKMNKLITSIAVCLLAVYAASGQMDSLTVTHSLITTNSATDTYVLRGEIEGVYVDVAATKTNVILITSEEQTIFSATVSADKYYPIAAPLYGTTGSALTESYSIWDNITNSVGTNPLYGKIAVAGDVTIRAAGAADTTGTNAVSVTVIWKK